MPTKFVPANQQVTLSYYYYYYYYELIFATTKRINQQHTPKAIDRSTRTMKILRSSIQSKNLEGVVVFEAEEDEDMYQLYNLIAQGDEIEAPTIRNVSACLLFRLASVS
jgi:hypothetical protein